MIQGGDNQHITGLFFFPENQKGYGNSPDRKDTYLFEWDRDKGIFTVLVFKGWSKDGQGDKNLFELWLKGGISRKVLQNRKGLENEQV